jgi:hypothetical protein
LVREHHGNALIGKSLCGELWIGRVSASPAKRNEDVSARVERMSAIGA